MTALRGYGMLHDTLRYFILFQWVFLFSQGTFIIQRFLYPLGIEKDKPSTKWCDRHLEKEKNLIF